MHSHPGILGKGGSPQRKCLTFAVVDIRSRMRTVKRPPESRGVMPSGAFEELEIDVTGRICRASMRH